MLATQTTRTKVGGRGHHFTQKGTGGTPTQGYAQVTSLSKPQVGIREDPSSHSILLASGKQGRGKFAEEEELGPPRLYSDG